MLYFLGRPRAARWIVFDGYKYTEIKRKVWSIVMVQWIVVREDLIILKYTGFRYSLEIHYYT